MEPPPAPIITITSATTLPEGSDYSFHYDAATQAAAVAQFVADMNALVAAAHAIPVPTV